MSSVGYGDMFPTSDMGRFITSVVMVSGILTLAVPLTLLGARFNECWVEHAVKKRQQSTIITLQKNGVQTGAKLLRQKSGEEPPNPSAVSGDVQFANPPIDDDAGPNGTSPDDLEKLAREAALDYARKVKTTMMVARIVLAECAKSTGDQRFALALGYIQDAEGELGTTDTSQPEPKPHELRLARLRSSELHSDVHQTVLEVELGSVDGEQDGSASKGVEQM